MSVLALRHDSFQLMGLHSSIKIRSPLGLQKSNQKEKEVDPYSQLDSPGKKKSKVGSALRSQYNFGEGRIKSSAPGKLVSVSEFRHSR
jgi:hypothetical protein